MSSYHYVSKYFYSRYLASVMDRYCLIALIFDLGFFGYACAAGNKYGTISVVGPAFVDREVTLKATPFYPWDCDVEWICMRDGSTTFQTMNGTNVKSYSEDGSFFLKWKASIEYNKSNFYAACSNTTIKTGITSLNMKDIIGQCGALVLLNPVVRGADVKLGFFPSDQSIKNQTNATRTWKKNIEKIDLRNGSYEEDIVSEYFYRLTVFNFDEEDEGTYILECNSVDTTESVHLYIQERPSYPVLGPKYPDFNTTGCIYVYGGSDVYCITDNGTQPVQVVLLIGNDSFVLAESKVNKGLYQFQNVHQQMAGLSRRNVTCQVSNAALDTPYEVHGILCNVEEGSPPELTVPEFVMGEGSTATCAVRNALPAPVIEIHVGRVLLADVHQTDSFNTSSNTFASRTKAKKTNKSWNGNEMCCNRQSNDYFGFKAVSTCKDISMKFSPSDLSITANKIHEYNNNVSVCYLNISCETSESNPPCRIEWSSDNDNITILHSNNWTNGENGSYRSVSNVLYTVTGDMAKGTITCATKCDHFSSHLNKNYKIYFAGKQCQDTDVQTFSSIFRIPVNNLLIGTGVFCGLCIVFAIGRYIFLNRLMVNAINTVEIVENHSDTSSEIDVIHISTEGVRYAVVQRQPATQKIETQQPHNDDSLTYAELDINFLQEAHARVPSRINDTRTEYADIEFHSTQEPAVEDPVYDNASAKI